MVKTGTLRQLLLLAESWDFLVEVYTCIITNSCTRSARFAACARSSFHSFYHDNYCSPHALAHYWRIYQPYRMKVVSSLAVRSGSQDFRDE